MTQVSTIDLTAFIIGQGVNDVLLGFSNMIPILILQISLATNLGDLNLLDFKSQFVLSDPRIKLFKFKSQDFSQLG